MTTLTKNDILFEDNHIIAVNKPSGILVQADTTGDEPLVDRVAAYLKQTYAKPGKVFCGVIHRIDRPVSGIVLFAKTSKALERMNALFQEKEIQKTYLALVINKPKKDNDTLEHWLIKNTMKHFSVAYNTESKGSQKAVLTFWLRASFKNGHLLEIAPATGRFHQIRAQLSKIGCSIKGDLKYGAKVPNLDKSICLHAFKIAFTHPIKQEFVEIMAPIPNIPEWAETFDFMKGFVLKLD